MGIVNDVMNTLQGSTAEIARIQERINEDERLIKSGQLSPAGVKVRQEAMAEAKEQRSRQKASAAAAVETLLREYVAKEARTDVLNPDEITDDAKFLSIGVKLTEKQVAGLIEKNANNRTMTQLILKYAKDNDMNLPYLYQTAEEKAEENAQNIRYIMKLYLDHWIEAENADTMLQRLFLDK